MVIERKVIQTGRSLSINLPKYWCEKQNIKRKDTISILITKDDKLLLYVKNGE